MYLTQPPFKRINGRLRLCEAGGDVVGQPVWQTKCLSGVTLQDFFRENGFMHRHQKIFSFHNADGMLQQLESYAELEELDEPRRVATKNAAKDDHVQSDQ